MSHHHLNSTQQPRHHPPQLCHLDRAHNNRATHNCYVCEFFLYSCFLLLLNVLYRYYLCSSCTEGLVQGNDDNIGPLVSNFFFNLCYFQLLTRTIYRLMNGLKQRDPNDGYTIVWLLGLKTWMFLEPIVHVCFATSPPQFHTTTTSPPTSTVSSPRPCHINQPCHTMMKSRVRWMEGTNEDTEGTK